MVSFAAVRIWISFLCKWSDIKPGLIKLIYKYKRSTLYVFVLRLPRWQSSFVVHWNWLSLDLHIGSDLPRMLWARWSLRSAAGTSACREEENRCAGRRSAPARRYYYICIVRWRMPELAWDKFPVMKSRLIWKVVAEASKPLRQSAISEFNMKARWCSAGMRARACMCRTLAQDLPCLRLSRILASSIC